MTGYGKATVTFGEKKIHVELKSLNSKAMDLSVRIAPLYREKEMEIRNIITKSLERGKVDFSLWIEKEVSEMATPINAALMNNYYEQIKNITSTTEIPMPTDLFATLLRMPDVLTKVDIQELTDVLFWTNPRLKEMDWRMVDGHPQKVQKYPHATTGEQLYKSLCTIAERYGVEFRFCTKNKTGEEIVRILKGSDNDG